MTINAAALKGEPGIYFEVSWADYLQIDAVNQSLLKHGLRSMKRLKRAMDGECKPDRNTVAVGNAVHALIAGELEDRFAIMPAFEHQPGNVTGTGKPSKSTTTAWYKEQKSAYLAEVESNRMELLKDVEFKTARKVLDQIIQNQEHSHCYDLIQRSRQEVTVIAEIHGVLCKTRIDGFAPREHMAWDLKTTSDIESTAFYRTFKRMKYAFQFCFQKLLLEKHGIQLQQYKVIAAEVCGDYDVALVPIPFQVIDNQENRIETVLHQYRQAKKSGRWAGVANGMEYALNVPNWDMTEDDAVDWDEVNQADPSTAVAF